MTQQPIQRILVVDDEPDVAQMLARVLQTLGDFKLAVCHSAEEALRDRADFEPHLVFTDLVMPGLSGLDFMKRARELGVTAPFIVVSAYSTIENAVDAVKAGASDFLPKPFGPREIELVLARTRNEVAALQDAAKLRRQVAMQDPKLAALVGKSPAIRTLKEWIVRARGVSANALIEGETGTGKELVARALHAAGPFVAVNVAAIPIELAESELFGHKAGAFTGATRDRTGLLVEAHGGTLFLDEVNGMNLGLQAKLLRALEERGVRPLGASRDVAVNFRLIAASNEPLELLVQSGKFRADLYHRLNVLRVRLPPLRDRPEDISLLAQEFLDQYAAAHDRRVRRFAPEALQWLSLGDWPGNVRELENCIERAVIFAHDGAAELSLDAVRGYERHSPVSGGEDLVFLNPRWTLAEVERHYVAAVLKHTGGNKSRASRILDIDYKTLLRKQDH